MSTSARAAVPCKSVALPKFKERASFRIAVANFSGADKSSRAFGVAVGDALGDALLRYLAANVAQIDGVLSVDDIDVGRLKCVIPNDEDARSLGIRIGADVVIWGDAKLKDGLSTVTASALNRATAINLNVTGGIGNNNHTTVQGGGTVINGVYVKQEIITGVAESVFQPNLTIVGMKGATSSATAGVGDHSAISLRAQALPGLLTSRPLALFEFALGLFAFEREAFTVAAGFFDKVDRDLDDAQSVSVLSRLENRGTVYEILGITYLQTGNLEAAAKALERARDDCRQVDNFCRALNKLELCQLEFRRGHAQTAVDCMKDAVDVAKGTIFEAVAMAALVATAGQAGVILPDESDLLQRAYDLAIKTSSRRAGLATLNALGVIAMRDSDAVAAEKFLRSGLQLSDSPSFTALFKGNLGFLLDTRGDAAGAKEGQQLLEEAARLRGQLGEYSEAAFTWFNLARKARIAREFARADDYLTHAQDTVARTTDESLKSMVKGEACGLKRDRVEMQAFCKDATAVREFVQCTDDVLSVQQKLGRKDLVPNVRFSKAQMYAECGDADRALPIAEQTRKEYEQIHDVDQTLTATSLIGEIKLKQKKFADAHKLLDQVRRESRASNLMRSFTAARYELVACIGTHDASCLMDAGGDAVHIAELVGNVPLADTVRSEVAWALLMIDDGPDAFEVYRKVLEVDLQNTRKDESIGVFLRMLVILNSLDRSRDDMRQKVDEALADLEQLDLPANEKLAQRARILWRLGRAADRSAAKAAYTELAEKTRASSDPEDAVLMRIAAAGLARISASGTWLGCPGVFVIKVLNTAAEEVGFRVGDIILRSHGTCAEDFRDPGETRPKRSVDVDVLRGSAVVHLKSNVTTAELEMIGF